MKKVDLSAFTQSGVSVEGDIYTFSREGGRLKSEFTRGTLFGESFPSTAHLVMDVTNHSPYSCSVIWDLYDGGERPSETIKMGLFAGVRTRLALPLSDLEGGTLFLRRTSGKLKTVVLGAPVKLRDLCGFAVAIPQNVCETALEIHAFYVTEEKVEYPVPDMLLVDEMGQKKNGEWQGKTPSKEHMISYLNDALLKDATPLPNRSHYGGTLDKRFEPSGFFRIVRDGGRFYLADPDGYAFFSSGLDCVGIDGAANMYGIEKFCENLPGRENAGWGKTHDGSLSYSFSHAKANLYAAFGEDYYDKWCDLTKKRMLSWGFNTVACWSDGRFIEKANMPYVHILGGFPRTQRYIFRDFPDVFSKEYQESAVQWAKQLEGKANDKYMIGYFMSNEPNWAFVDNLNIARMTLESDVQFASRTPITDALKKKYGTLDALNSAWESDYTSFETIGAPFNKKADDDLSEISAILVREFVRVPALALREVDKNHLNLGMRYAWISSPALAAGSEYFDVFSINCYSHDPYGSIEHTVKMTDKPVMIGEFHFGALDCGMDATGIRGVASQEDRAKAYNYYMQRAASHPYCLGAHYFILNDQSYLGRFDGENYQIGFVDVCNVPYKEMTEGATKTNASLYDVASGKIAVTDVRAKEIPPICY